MGIFQKFIPIFNRAPVDLFVMFDGQQETIPPGKGALPEVTVPFAKNQNPVMGSGDTNNPTMGGCRYLIVEEGDEGFGEPLSKEDWEMHLGRPCRWDEEAAFAEKYADDPKARLVKRGSSKSTARSRYEAATSASTAVFTGKD